MRVELAQQILECLPGAENADVRQRRRRQITAQYVASVGAHCGAVSRLRPAPELSIFFGLIVAQSLPRRGIAHFELLDGQRLADMLDHRLHLLGISLEE